MRDWRIRILIAVTAIFAGAAMPQSGSRAADATLARGKYLVALGGCFDCHTRGYFMGKPDMAKALAGSDVGFEMPEMGVFVGPNLTPDKETGLGRWTVRQIMAALRTGARPDGRVLVPIMPWRSFANLSDADARAIALYLKSLPPVVNKVAGPFAPTEKASVFVMKLVPPEAK